ncbi:homing endonuclease associated repeat-containing protein, partial [Natrinema sp. H-ect1]|uniref:homing endonuclease associated repeat-containing protein n=1 Tax=Natrinema sp. H-ect1 TaxID=3242700 RepID=UPI00359DC376
MYNSSVAFSANPRSIVPCGISVSPVGSIDSTSPLEASYIANDTSHSETIQHQERLTIYHWSLNAGGSVKTTEVEVVADLVAHLDRRPYQDDLDEHSRFDSRAYQQRFESWDAALKAAEFNPSVRIPDDFLIADLWRVALLDETYSETASKTDKPVFSEIDDWWSLSVEKLQQ